VALVSGMGVFAWLGILVFLELRTVVISILPHPRMIPRVISGHLSLPCGHSSLAVFHMICLLG